MAMAMGNKEFKNLMITLKSMVLLSTKPVVEKPINAEFDHTIAIYYPTLACGGCKKIFHKVGNQSSEFYPCILTVNCFPVTFLLMTQLSYLLAVKPQSSTSFNPEFFPKQLLCLKSSIQGFQQFNIDVIAIFWPNARNNW